MDRTVLGRVTGKMRSSQNYATDGNRGTKFTPQGERGLFRVLVASLSLWEGRGEGWPTSASECVIVSVILGEVPSREASV